MSIWYVSPDGTIYINLGELPPDAGSYATIEPFPPTSGPDNLRNFQSLMDMKDNRRIKKAQADYWEAKARNERSRTNPFKLW